MKQTTLTQAIQDLTQDNLTVNMMDTIISGAIDKQFNEVFGPSSKCTLGGFWDPKPVAIDPSVLEQFIPVTMSILERLEHNLMVHDQMYNKLMTEYGLSVEVESQKPALRPFYTIMANSLSGCYQGSRRMYGNTINLPVVSPFNV